MNIKEFFISFFITALTGFVVYSLVIYLWEGRFFWGKSIVLAISVGISVPLFTLFFRRKK
ncbi:hypothetical protein ACFLT9_00950 [Acidobacteriota bacterium]